VQLPDASEAPASFTLTPAMLATAGTHAVSIVAHDGAGNTGTLLAQQVLVAPALLDGPAPASRYDGTRNLFFNPDADVSSPTRPNGINAGAANVSLSFVTRHVVRSKGRRRTVTRFTKRRTVSYNTAVRMRARLSTAGGLPITGARVYRAMSIAGGPWRLAAKPLVTSKTGRVSVLLPAHSPSRRVELVYFPATASNDSSRSKARLLAVRAPMSLGLSRHAVARGTRITVNARLRAGIRPGSSVLGVLQVLKRGDWQPFRQLRFTSRGHGRAHAALRLSTASTYRFRLRISAQPGLRYATGVSRARTLRVG
jgi:hypothetical protein